MLPTDPACPVCGAGGARRFYEVKEVPVHSVLLMRSAEAARQIGRGSITLAHCDRCSMIWNTVFDPVALTYNEEYEETQGYSPTFNRFHRRLAEYLVNRAGARNKHIVEIGCGKGEFLDLLCELGNNEGVGYDPAFVPGRAARSGVARTRFVQENFPPRTPGEAADFYCCKMTLEHVPDPGKLITALRDEIGNKPADVYFLVPAVERILQQTAFWDIYYEHCNYFSSQSLRFLFESRGFQVREIHYSYDEQYIGLLAHAGSAAAGGDTGSALSPGVYEFEGGAARRIRAWNRLVNESGKRLAVWGAGSKAVALLQATDAPESIVSLVDINPYKQGSYLPGTGHRIEAPASLASESPDTVVIMNPVYRAEIRTELEALGLDCELFTLEEDLRY